MAMDYSIPDIGRHSGSPRGRKGGPLVAGGDVGPQGADRGGGENDDGGRRGGLPARCRQK